MHAFELPGQSLSAEATLTNADQVVYKQQKFPALGSGGQNRRSGRQHGQVLMMALFQAAACQPLLVSSWGGEQRGHWSRCGMGAGQAPSTLGGPPPTLQGTYLSGAS